MKIVFSPYINDTNKYIEILIRSLVDKGVEIVSFKDMFTSLRCFLSVKIIHLNWYESLSSVESKFNKTKQFIRKILVLIFLKCCNKKIVWTMHNKISHEKSLSYIQKILMKFVIKTSSKIIIHCKQSETILINDLKIKNSKKICYIPHPNYIDVYGDIVPSYQRNDKLRLLFFGAVKPYKNIELLIDAVKQFPQEIELVIAGKTKTLEYERELKKRVENTSNITLNLKFIKDDDIPTYLSNCDLSVFPYDISSSLNSGSIFLSFSYGKSVISPEIGTIQDLPNKNYIFSYTYETQEEHFIQLSNKLKAVIEQWTTNHAIFEEWGQIMREYVKKNNIKNIIADDLIEAYKSIN